MPYVGLGPVKCPKWQPQWLLSAVDGRRLSRADSASLTAVCVSSWIPLFLLESSIISVFYKPNKAKYAGTL